MLQIFYISITEFQKIPALSQVYEDNQKEDRLKETSYLILDDGKTLLKPEGPFCYYSDEEDFSDSVYPRIDNVVRGWVKKKRKRN